MTCGIYVIKNIITNQLYIGKSTNIEKRWKRHLYLLNSNKDTCLYLQNAWNKYKSENFDFYIINECVISELDTKEKIAIKKFKSHYTENGYNISWGGSSPFLGRHHTEESKRKISENSEDRTGKNNPMFGRKHTEQAKLNISKNNVGMTGRKHSQESKDKNRKSKTGTKIANTDNMKKAQQNRRLKEKLLKQEL